MKKILKRQGMGLLGIMVALAIIGLMCFFVLRSVKKSGNNSNKDYIEKAGVDTSSYKGMLDSTQKIIKDAEATRAQVPQ